MAIVECKNGHYYDDEYHKECPYCKSKTNEINFENIDAEELTQQIHSTEDSHRKLRPKAGMGSYVTIKENTRPPEAHEFRMKR